MIRNISIILLIALIPLAKAKADVFLVQDQNGRPIKNAVIEFIASDVLGLTTSPKTLVMDQVNKRFNPNVLVINKGDYVSFPNSDDIRHHVYSFSPVMPFELKLYSGKSKAPLQFNNAGISVLGCNIHDSMVGYIYIANSPYTILTNENGEAELNTSLAYKSINIWHPNLSTEMNQTLKIIREDLVSKEGKRKKFMIKLIIDAPKPRNTFQSIFKK